MKQQRGQIGFTLIELLVVIAIISLLTSILVPSLTAAKSLARAAVCLSNLHGLGSAAAGYQTANDGYFWPYRLDNHPAPPTRCYWWGADADPVDASASPFMEYCDNSMERLWCPSMQWGSYIPQGAYVSEPTTTYGYNAYYLDPQLAGKTCRRMSSVPKPSELFVLNDAAMSWKVSGRTILQNSTYLEPVTGNWVQQPTTHFRHGDRTHALCADGHAQAYGPDGWDVAENKLGFVGTRNYPHYEQ